MVKHNCLSHKLWTDLFTWFDILKTSQIYAAIFLFFFDFFFIFQIYVSNTSAGLKGSWPLVAGVLNDRWWEPTPIILHTFLHLSKLFQNILTSDSQKWSISVFDGDPQICYRKSASDSTEIQYCAFLSFQEWPLPLLSECNSVYWWKHLMSEHHSTREPVSVYRKHWKKNKQKTSPVREHNETPWFWFKCRRCPHETPPSLRPPFFQWFHTPFLTGTPCALHHVTNESLTKDHNPFRIFRVAFLHEYPWPCASPTVIKRRCAGFSNSTWHWQ